MNRKDFYISMDTSRMNLDFIHDYLSNQSYWAKNRSKEEVLKSMENSICFGVFDLSHNQVGFARLVTDYVVFAWLMDVFIADESKGKGLGKMLLQYITELPELQNVNGIGLRTKDAHGLYQKFGFRSIDDPVTWMLRKKEIK